MARARRAVAASPAPEKPKFPIITSHAYIEMDKVNHDLEGRIYRTSENTVVFAHACEDRHEFSISNIAKLLDTVQDMPITPEDEVPASF